MDTLLVAVGGGGDAITSAALRRHLRLSQPPVIMTYSWDRLMVDPLPGPRNAEDFSGLRRLAPKVFEVTPLTVARLPAGSSLPRLAADLSARIILLDPSAGAVGLAEQIANTALHFGLNNVTAVDVGGDALTNGHDPGLRSPLADQLALAACVRADLPTTLLIAAAGIDGELTTTALATRLRQFNGTRFGEVSAEDVALVEGVLRWHPTEASGLLAAAALGLRGTVEIRDAGDQVELTDATPAIFALDALIVASDTPAHQLLDTTSLTVAEDRIQKLTGISEIRYETEKARRLEHRPAHMPTSRDLQRIDTFAQEAAGRGADLVSIRRLAELVGATSLDAFGELTRLLSSQRPEQYALGAYRVRARIIEPLRN